jgi:bacillithiol system protein YtxJ
MGFGHAFNEACGKFVTERKGWMMERLTNSHQLQHMLNRSGEEMVLLFKHSTVCPVSAAAHEELMRFTESEEAKRVRVGFIYVIEDRPVSNEAAQWLGVKHESPQALLVKNGKAVWYASHWNITTEALKQAVRTFGT